MNEFIVWDENTQSWVKNFNHVITIDDSGILKTNHNRFKLFMGIGKTDIEGNKIYADSSIIEWEHQENIYRGYFTFNKKYLRYEVITKDHQSKPIAIEFFYLEHNGFKIIGTLQEDKHLIGEK